MFPVSNVHPPPDVGAEPPGLDAAVKAALSGAPAAAAAPPDPYADDQKLLDLFSHYAKQCSDRRSAFERIWWRTLLYLLGRQWIYFERSVNQWVDKRLQKWIPRPVTNVMLRVLETILSVFQGVDLSVSVRPVGAEPNDIMAADTANKYEAPLRQDHDMHRVQRESDWWLTALGNVAWCVWWDYSGNSTTTFVPYEQCATCEKVSPPQDVIKAGDVCPYCGSPILNQSDQGQQVSPGHGTTDVVSPLEYTFPAIYADPNLSPVVIRYRWRSKEYYEGRYDESITKKIQWETMAQERSLQLLRSLASTTDVGSLPNSGIGGEPTEIEGATEAELWVQPTKDFPDGLVMRVVGANNQGAEQVLRLPSEGIPGPLPFKTNDGKRIWNWIFTGFQQFGGRGWKRSPLEMIVEKQNQLNQIDSIIQLIAQRCANPVWLEPKGAEVTKFTGEPGLVVKWNPLAAGGNAKPERIEGQNIPQSLINLREMILEDIRDLTGTAQPLGGQKPTGVDSFSGMQLLVEQAQSRFGPVLEGRGELYRRWYKIALDLERQLGNEERAYAVLGPNGAFRRETFQKAHLDGAIRVEVEDGSQMPKTALGTRAAIQQLQTLGVIDPKQPETSYRILQIFGRTDLSPGLDAQVMGARREQQAFEEWAATATFVQPPPQPIQGPTGAMVLDPATGQPAMQPPGPPQPSTPPPGQMKAWHDPRVHLEEHMKWANSDVMQQLFEQKPALEPLVAQMISDHQNQIVQTTPPQPPKIQYQFKGPDLADPQIREVFDRAENVATPPPPPGVAPAPPGHHAPGNGNGNVTAVGHDGHGAGAGRALHNSNQESGNVNDLLAPPSGHEGKVG